MEFGSRVLRYTKAFCAVLIASCALLAPLKSDAQSGQVVVMTCTNQYPGQRNLTIDLAAKKLVEQVIAATGAVSRDVHKLTQLTNQQIVWIEARTDGGHRYGYTFTLNRYTGVLTLVPFGSVDGVTPWETQMGYPHPCPARNSRNSFERHARMAWIRPRVPYSTQ